MRSSERYVIKVENVLKPRFPESQFVRQPEVRRPAEVVDASQVQGRARVRGEHPASQGRRLLLK